MKPPRLLPDEVLDRRKSPYPKTHNPGYEAILKQRLRAVLQQSDSPLHGLIAEDVIHGLLGESFDYGQTVVWPVDGRAAAARLSFADR